MAVRVGVLGATGAVGQRLIQLLDPHPEFEIAALTASDASAGKTYRQAAKWRVDSPIPSDVADSTVTATDPDEVPDDIDLLFSSLPSSVGAAVEPGFCDAGYVVSSNSSNGRMDDDIPLVIPEVNAEHLDLLEVQRDERGWDGAMVKNPNCSTITFVPTLAALTEFGLEKVHVSTLQAVSGAGYDGVSSMEIIDNAIPYIGGEEDKLETESRKLLGDFDGASLSHNDMAVSASCNRIPTIDGHLENVWVETEDDLTPRRRPRPCGSTHRSTCAPRLTRSSTSSRSRIDRSRGWTARSATGWPSPRAVCRSRRSASSTTVSHTIRSAVPPARASSTANCCSRTATSAV